MKLKSPLYFIVVLLIFCNATLGQPTTNIGFPWIVDKDASVALLNVGVNGGIKIQGAYTIEDVIKVLNELPQLKQAGFSCEINYDYYLVKNKNSAIAQAESRKVELDIYGSDLREVISAICKEFHYGYNAVAHSVIFFRFSDNDKLEEKYFKFLMLPSLKFQGKSVRELVDFLNPQIKNFDSSIEADAHIKLIDDGNSSPALIFISNDKLFPVGDILIRLQDFGYELYFQDRDLVVERKK